MFPPTVKPHEVGILIARLVLNVREPREIARLFHYETTRPVEKVLARYRQFIHEYYVLRDATKPQKSVYGAILCEVPSPHRPYTGDG